MLYSSGLLALCLLFVNYAQCSPVQAQASNISNSSYPIIADETRGDQHGDTIGVTRCYCMSQNWEHDNMFGYYYLWDYYNVHTNHRFLVEATCHKNTWSLWGFFYDKYELVCLRFQNRLRFYGKDHAGNKFWYELNGKEQLDFFGYNQQTRQLPPVDHGIHTPSDEVVEKCNAYCHDKVGSEMVMLDGRAVRYAEQRTPGHTGFRGYDNEWSHITFYPEIDDMCHGCKK